MNPDRPRSEFWSSIRRWGVLVLRALGVAIAIIASLLTFPAWLPALALAWTGFALWRTWQSRSAAPAIVLGGLLIAVKQPPPLPGVLSLGLLLVIAVVLDLALARRQPPIRPSVLSAVLLAGWMALAGEWWQSSHTRRSPQFDPHRPVVLIGDSLLAGEHDRGVAPDLQSLVSVPVLDLSQAGITTTDALKKLAALRNARPQAVVIELGGHDFLRGHSRAQAHRNLVEFIEAARELGAEVILMELPRDFIRDPWWGLERELCSEYDLELIPDTPVRELIFWSPSIPPGAWFPARRLSDDGLHPNSRGNVHLARTMSASLERIFGSPIRRPPDQ